MWSLDKLIQPGHAAAVFENFYFISGIGTEILLVIGLAQLAIEVAFLLGLWKFWTYRFRHGHPRRLDTVVLETIPGPLQQHAVSGCNSHAGSLYRTVPASKERTRY